jgi:hypothetical protein
LIDIEFLFLSTLARRVPRAVPESVQRLSPCGAGAAHTASNSNRQPRQD